MDGASTARQALVRINDRIDRLVDRRHRLWLTTFRDHWWAEAIGDIDGVMATMSRGAIRYSFDGHDLMAAQIPMSAVDTYAKTRAMYERVCRCGIRMAGTFDNERVLFDDDGLMISYLLTAIYSGLFIKNADRPIAPDAFYVVRMSQIVGVAFDSQGLMKGEEIFNGAPLLIAEVGADEVGSLVDGPMPSCLVPVASRPA